MELSTVEIIGYTLIPFVLCVGMLCVLYINAPICEDCDDNTIP